MNKWYSLIIILLLSYFKSYSQPIISYITPDIGAPGMAVYVELIGPYNLKNNFGIDGVYLSKNQRTRIVLADPADSNKVKIGPAIVSWEGRMISTIIYINETLNPDKYDALEASPMYQIELQVKLDDKYSNTQTFYIVISRPYIDLSLSGASIPDSIFGEGQLGKRSPRGAMIFDSIKLGPRKYWVSANDCDPNISGNQALLPFTLMVKGSLTGTPGSSKITANGGDVLVKGVSNGMVQDASAGGGAGGGSFNDFTGMGFRGGNGFTGGGAGGRNKSGNIFSSDEFTPPSEGSGPRLDNTYGGYSLNGLPGPKQAAYEAAGGGTGHPFGRSGEGCGDGANCEPDGGAGGGSGWKQNSPGGSGGYATEGSSSVANGGNGGHTYGNIMVVPVAGGSGGAGGNPQCIPYGSSAAAGAGGGAIRVYALSISGVNFEAIGAGGATNACDNSVGGSGSGGFIGIQSKMPLSKIKINVDGGLNNRTLGGAGRVRYDYPQSSDLTLSTANASTYRGPTTDTSHIIFSNHILHGSQAANKTSRIYISKDTNDWNLLGEVKDELWSYDLTSYLNKKSGTYYIAVTTIVDKPVITDYAAEPHEIFSQAATNILKLDLRPFVNGDTNITAKQIYCIGESMILSAKIWNKKEAEAILDLQFSDNNWLLGDNGFKILGPVKNGTYSIKPGDTSEILVEYIIPAGADPAQKASNILLIPSNDPDRSKGKEWRIKFEIDAAYTPNLTYVGTPPSSFVDTKVGSTSVISYTLKNTGNSKLFLPYIQNIPAPFELVSTIPALPVLLNLDDTIRVNVKFSPKNQGDYSTIAVLIAEKTDSTCSFEQHTELKGKGIESDITFPSQIDLGPVPYCKLDTISIPITNKSSAPFSIKMFPKIIGADADLFKVISTQKDEILIQPGLGVKYIVQLSPNKLRIGPVSARLYFTTDDAKYDTIFVDLTAEIIGFDVKSIPDTIQLGDIAIGFETQSSFDLINNSKIDNKIGSVFSTSGFANMIQLSDSVLLAQNGNAKVNFNIHPTLAGNINDSIVVIIDEPCVDSLKVYIKGRAILSKPTVYIDNDIVIKDTNNLERREVSFGDLSICETSSLRKLVEYVNSSDAPYIVLKEELINDAGGRYKLVSTSISVPDTIYPSNTTRLPGAMIEFNPNGAAATNYNGIIRITIFINGKELEYNINLRANVYVGKFAISDNPINMNAVVGTTQSFPFTIENLGPDSLIIINHIPPSLSSIFAITPNPDGTIISIGQPKTFNIEFSPDQLVTYRDSITFITSNSNCDSNIVIYLNGKGEPSKELVVYIPEIQTDPLQKNFKIPIYAKFKKATDSLDGINLTFDLRFNRSLFLPNDLDSGMMLQNIIDGKDRLLSFDFRGVNISPSDTLLGSLIGTTMLGDSKTTDLTISNVILHNVGLVSSIESKDGKLTIEICEEGGDRLLDHQLNPFKIEINPNPVSEVINMNITTLEKGLHKLIISDISGKELYTSDWNSAYVGMAKNIKIDASQYESGIYFVKVISPNDVIISKINLIK